jgi:hypothetical protein
LLAVFCVTLPAVPEVHAGKGKPGFVRVSKQHVRSGRGSGFAQKRSHKRSERPDFVKRRAQRRGNHYGSGYGYGSSYGYGYDRGYRYRDYQQPAPSYRPEASAPVQSYQDRPVTPKWVHVSSLDDDLGPSTLEGSYAEGGLRRNCLSVKTQITVDGKPMDAFGEACLSADGTLDLKPSQGNE